MAVSLTESPVAASDKGVWDRLSPYTGPWQVLIIVPVAVTAVRIRVHSLVK